MPARAAGCFAVAALWVFLWNSDRPLAPLEMHAEEPELAHLPDEIPGEYLVLPPLGDIGIDLLPGFRGSGNGQTVAEPAGHDHQRAI